MKKIFALWNREFIEHRGAFMWAPLIVLGIFALTVASTVGRARFDLPPEVKVLPTRRLLEDAILVAFVMWWIYSAAALFFYYADAFNADKRNNAMLFWKSLPVSDFGMLLSKMTYGMVAFVILTTVMTALSSVLLGGLALGIGFIVPSIQPPAIADVVSSIGSLVVLAAGYAALSVLWYAPFLAWVGGLSTVVGRWSIPLAFFVPSALSLMEVSVFRTFNVSQFLQWRLQFGIDWQVLAGMFYTIVPLNGVDVLQIVLMGINWLQLGAGIVIALVLIYLASLWRRRGLAG